MLKLSILAAAFILFLASCSSSSTTTAPVPEADPFCSSTVSYTSSLTLSGSAVYEYRVNGNGIVSVTPNPIRQAEIAVYDAGGNIVQCGATDDSGNFSVNVPNPAVNLVLRVNSRISNSLTKAYVLNNPSDMDHHYIKTAAINSSSNVSLGTLTAPATGTLEGGAFNILDKILVANTYLLNQTLNCNGTYTNCPPFTGTSLVKIFWTKGVNPGTYFNEGPVSFYIRGQSELYILGGISGDVDDSDTDHFDNSIIIHEYGHFIEDILSKTDSPGGAHTGDGLLDPRLAWGEGWANFFQAAVLQNPIYLDTVGNPDGTPDIYFDEDLETPQHDLPVNPGEGNFREFSISRLLWDAIDDGSLNVSTTDDDTVVTPFSELWTVFTNPVNGFKYAGNHFRNVARFHQIQDTLAGRTDWSTLRNAENHRLTELDYARGVTSTVGACAAVGITPANMSMAPAENGTFANSNPMASNDFYKIYHGGGAFNFELAHASTPTVTADLDVYIYYEDYKFGKTSSIAAKKATVFPVSTTYSSSEVLSATLPAGFYMINIHANTKTRLGNYTEYTMRLNGANLCPN